jgi:hypothetical protein
MATPPLEFIDLAVQWSEERIRRIGAPGKISRLFTPKKLRIIHSKEATRL